MENRSAQLLKGVSLVPWCCCGGCSIRFRGFDGPAFPSNWTIVGNTASTTTPNVSDFAALKLRGTEVNDYDVTFDYSVSGVLSFNSFSIDSATGKLTGPIDGTGGFQSVDCGSSGTIRIVKGSELGSSGVTGGDWSGVELWLDGTLQFFNPFAGGKPSFVFGSGTSASVTIHEETITRVDPFSEDETCSTIGRGWLWPPGQVSSVTVELATASKNPPFDCSTCDGISGSYTCFATTDLVIGNPNEVTFMSTPTYPPPSDCGLWIVGAYLAQLIPRAGVHGYVVSAGPVALINDPAIVDYDDPDNWVPLEMFRADTADCVAPTSTLDLPGISNVFCDSLSCTATANYS